MKGQAFEEISVPAIPGSEISYGFAMMAGLPTHLSFFGKASAIGAILLLWKVGAVAADLPPSLREATIPPLEWQNQGGAYRSPLLFRDGSRVTNGQDWQRRRAEILSEWQTRLGQWPPVLEKPTLEILSSTQREGITQQRVRVQIAPDQHGEGYLLIPANAQNLAAVFVPFYEPETSVGLAGKPWRDFAWQLARRGFVTLSLGSPGGDARKPVMSSKAQCQPLSYLAYVSANAWQALAQLPFVDAQRIGIVGHSYGGKWAMFGACLWPKYACGAWSDPGIVFDESRASINYQEPWYLGLDPKVTRAPGLVSADRPRTGAYRTLIEKGHDLVELQALMAPRPFLVSGGAEDPPKRWMALNHIRAVYELLGHDSRVAMSNRESHDPNESSNELIYTFFEHWLKTKRSSD